MTMLSGLCSTASESWRNFISVCLRWVMTSNTATKWSRCGLYTAIETHICRELTNTSNRSGWPVLATRPKISEHFRVGLPDARNDFGHLPADDIPQTRQRLERLIDAEVYEIQG